MDYKNENDFKEYEEFTSTASFWFNQNRKDRNATT